MASQPSASGPSTPSGQYPEKRLAPRIQISPGPSSEMPPGAGTPSSSSGSCSAVSRSCSSTPGTGPPMHAGLARPVASVLATTGQASVSP